MGCFLGCFGGGRKNRRRQKFRESDQAKSTKLSAESAKPVSVPTVEEIPIPVTEICDKVEEKCSPSPNRKKVTFDSNVKTHEHIVLQDSVELLEEKKEEVKSEERSLNSNKTDPEIINVTSNSTGLYPSNHRYNNCRESDDEIEEDELHCNESDDEEYYSDDGFSEDKLHNVTKEDYIEEIGDNGLEIEEIDAKSRGVLNPVENLTQWKSAKSKERTMQKQSQKENSSLISDQEDKSDSSSFKKPRNEEVTVEASLSTWLSTSESNSECNSVSMETPTIEKHKSSHYSKPVHKSSHDDRPILGALTLEEIKQFSATSTPRKSPSKSAVETPIIGTVGGYWGSSSSNDYSKAKDCGSASSFKGIPNTTSKYREDKSVSWHSTPFEARLEKALNSKEKSFDLAT